MSCQDVCMTADYDGSTEFCRESTHRARKEYRCCECRDVIAVGAKYEYVSGKFEGEFYTLKTCLLCVEIRHAFYCGGWMLETLWDDMREQMFEHWNEMTAIDCLAKLETPAAIAKVRAAFAEWHKAWHADKDLPPWAAPEKAAVESPPSSPSEPVDQ